jgi:hypothetical protein
LPPPLLDDELDDELFWVPSEPQEAATAAIAGKEKSARVNGE